MKQIYFVLVYCLVKASQALNLPGPLVYVVTPSPKPPQHEGRAAPFYYNNWMKRIDSPNITMTTTTVKPTIKSPDLIFAEFESDNSGDKQKSLRKLLEKERIELKTSTTMKPIYINNDMTVESSPVPNYGQPIKTTKTNKEEVDSSNAMEDYFSQYNNIYNAPAPVYLPSTKVKLISTTTPATTITSSTQNPMNVENIWHIIDNEKYNQYSGNWEEIPIKDNNSETTNKVTSGVDQNKEENDKLEDNFVLPGFSTKSAENESRAIRTEPNIRFPYVDLKTYQMKNPQKTFLNSKKGNNMYSNLDNFQEIKNPVRGESQDIVPIRQQIDRYNPAQPYLPAYGTKSKQSSAIPSVPSKAVANLIPPPPPPPPPQSSDSLLPPSTYDSFPPYAQPIPDSPSPAPLNFKPSSDVFQSSAVDDSFDSPPSDTSADGPIMDLGYRYKPPSPPNFVPTIPPVTMSKPFSGYSYVKPPMDTDDSPPSPPLKGFSYNKPPKIMEDEPSPDPPFKGYSYDKPPMNNAPDAINNKPQYSGYNYKKPPALDLDTPSFSYGHHDAPIYGHNSDYPELIFNKPQDSSGDMKGSADMNANDMGMMPPPPPVDMKPDLAGPSDDQGFPHDFPVDFKYHDFDDHDHYHHHHHHTTTSTTTTETPRVNRYSYYYLGKKLYYLPLYFSVYFIIYVGALIIKAVLRHKIVYPNSWRPNDTTSTFFSKRSVESWDLSNENLHEITGRVTKALGNAAEKYITKKKDA